MPARIAYCASDVSEFIRDGGFEAGIFDFDVVRFPRYGISKKEMKPYLDNQNSIAGQNSLRIPAAPDFGYRVISKAYPLIAGGKYRLTFITKSLVNSNHLIVEVYQGWSIVKRQSSGIDRNIKRITLEFQARSEPALASKEVVHFFRVWVTGAGDVLLDDISLSGPAGSFDKAVQPAFSMAMDNKLGVYSIGEKGMLTIFVSGSACRACSIEYSIFDPFENSAVANGILKKVNDQLAERYEIGIDTKRRGYYRINMQLANRAGDIVDKQVITYVVVDSSKLALESRRRFGMSFEEHDQMSQINAFIMPDEYYDLAEKIGVGTARVFSLARPDMVSKDGLSFDFSQLDESLALLSKHSIEPMVVLGSNDLYRIPKWLRSCNDSDNNGTIDLMRGLLYEPDKKRLEGTLDQGRHLCLILYKRYLDKLLTHLKGRVKYFEVWNEPGHKFTAKDFIKLLKLTHDELKKIDVESKLLGFSSTTRDDHGKGYDLSYEPTFLREIVGLGGLSFVDILSYHSEHAFLFMHESPNHKDQRTDFVNRLRKTLAHNNLTNIPIWDTERGVPWKSNIRMDFMDGVKKWKHAHESEDLIEVANRLPMIYADALSNGVERLIWFNSESSIDVIQRSKARFGLFDSRSQPNPHIPVYDAMTQFLSGSEYVKFIETRNGDRVYIFKTANEVVALGYNWRGTTGMLSINKYNSGSKYRAFNVMGNECTKSDRSSCSGDFTILPTPKYWVMPGQNIDSIEFVKH